VAGPNASEYNNDHLTRVPNATENIGYVATIFFMSEPRLYVPGGRTLAFLEQFNCIAMVQKLK